MQPLMPCELSFHRSDDLFFTSLFLNILFNLISIYIYIFFIYLDLIRHGDFS